MMKYLVKTVIVPWDFSDMSKAALHAAINMVDSPDRIEVVHVTPYPAPMEPGVVWGTMTEGTIADNLNKSFDAFAKQEGLPDLKFTLQFGDPGSNIVDIAKQRDAGLIVISSHGRTGLKRLLMGSVAERVVRLGPCSVLVLRGQEEH